MDEFDDIEDLYQDMVNKFSGKPDDRSWSRLENNLDLDDVGVENWYKDKIENSNKIPHEKVWEDISMKIDTDTVWKRLAVSLQRRDKIIWWWQFSTSTLTLLAAVGIVLYTYFPNNEKPTLVNNTNFSKTKQVIQSSKNTLSNTKVVTPINKQKNNQITSNKTVDKTSLTQPKNTNNSNNNSSKTIKKGISNTENSIITKKRNSNSILMKSTNDLSKQSKKLNESINLNNQIVQPKFPTISAIPLITKLDLDELAFNMTSKPLDTLLFIDNTTPKNPRPHDYFYVEATIINPWLLNANTYNALRRNSTDYNQTLLAGGASLGYVHWLGKFGIEGSISYQEKGHNYMLYIEGKSYEKKINLDYAIASFSIKKSLTKDKTKPYNTFLTAGLYYGRAIHQNTIFNGLPYSQSVNYAKDDIGFTVNYEKQLQLKRNKLSFGVSISQGLIDIYRGNDYKEFSKTYNFTLSGSIKYIIPVKK